MISVNTDSYKKAIKLVHKYIEPIPWDHISPMLWMAFNSCKESFMARAVENIHINHDEDSYCVMPLPIRIEETAEDLNALEDWLYYQWNQDNSSLNGFVYPDAVGLIFSAEAKIRSMKDPPIENGIIDYDKVYRNLRTLPVREARIVVGSDYANDTYLSIRYQDEYDQYPVSLMPKDGSSENRYLGQAYEPFQRISALLGRVTENL